MPDSNDRVATSLGGVQVWFDGTPASLTLVSSTQINCVVPFEIQGVMTPNVTVSYQGQTSNSLELTSAASAPALFTADGTGTGAAAALNQDGSQNSPANPAAPGSTVVLFLTGEGHTGPPGETGMVTAGLPEVEQAVLPVKILIGDLGVFVTFQGPASDVVGVMRLEVQIPTNVPSGNLPISVVLGGNSTQAGVTLSVE